MNNDLKQEIFNKNIDFLTEEFNKLRTSVPVNPPLSWQRRFNEIRTILSASHKREVLLAELQRNDFEITMSFDMLGIDPFKAIASVDVDSAMNSFMTSTDSDKDISDFIPDNALSVTP